MDRKGPHPHPLTAVRADRLPALRRMVASSGPKRKAIVATITSITGLLRPVAAACKVCSRASVIISKATKRPAFTVKPVFFYGFAHEIILNALYLS